MSRVLVIDDDAAVAFALSRFLEAAGHTVRTASDAERGIALASREGVDVVLLDRRLPRVSGLEALGVFQRRWPQLPVIVVTAHGSPETERESVAAGALCELWKPIDIPELKRALERAAELTRAPT